MDIEDMMENLVGKSLETMEVQKKSTFAKARIELCKWLVDTHLKYNIPISKLLNMFEKTMKELSKKKGK